MELMDGMGTTDVALAGMARVAKMMAKAGMSIEDVRANAELIASTAQSADDWINGRLDLNAKPSTGSSAARRPLRRATRS